MLRYVARSVTVGSRLWMWKRMSFDDLFPKDPANANLYSTMVDVEIDFLASSHYETDQ